jgi:hypothetical protein
MSVSFLRFCMCWVMVLVLPVSLLGQAPGAILHSQGGVWVNDAEAVDSSAIFSGDSLETKPGFSASLTMDGSSILLAPETIGKFNGDVLDLDHGSVSVVTSKAFKVRVRCVTVIPVVDEMTKYEVTDVDGKIQVAAQKLDVKVHRETGHKPSAETQAAQGEGVVHESEQKSYDETALCGPPAEIKPSPGPNPKYYEIGGGAAGLILIICLIEHCAGGGGGGTKQPASTWSP